MAYLIGTDEAGYGPNLGPLVISASVWQLPEGTTADQLYEALQQAVCPMRVRTAENGSRVAIADSKRLYHQGQGLVHLERGVLAALGALGRHPSTWRELWAALSPDSQHQRDAIPWYAGYDGPVPVDNVPLVCQADADRLQGAFRASGVRLVDLRSRVVFEEPFNRLIEQFGTKGEALSQTTLELAAQVAASLEDGPISMICDKHGGRNRYQRLLMDWFPQSLIEIYDERRDRSVYRFGPPQRRVEVRFCTRAESYLPAALASMASKYLRELAMAAFNDFWCRRVPGLVRTAGYPADARRFKVAIAPVQTALGIEDCLLWRQR